MNRSIVLTGQSVSATSGTSNRSGWNDQNPSGSSATRGVAAKSRTPRIRKTVFTITITLDTRGNGCTPE